MHHIFCIHGIGKHGNEWVTEKDDLDQSFSEQMEQLWNKYNLNNTVGKFSDEVKLHSIHYDDEINKIFDSWATEVESLKKNIGSSSILKDNVEWYTDVIDKAAQAKKEDKLQYTHLFDLLLFVGSPMIQDRLVNYVGAQITTIIKDNFSSGNQFSLIGHSMGTAMAHKAIQAIFNEAVEIGGGKHTLKGDFMFESVTMVANTSYTLSRDKDHHYDEDKVIVKPSMTVGEGCCKKWFNINHSLDPVGQFWPFNYRTNPKWLDPVVENLGWHQDIQLHSVSSPSIHSINHYFRDPRFHIKFFELTFSIKFTDNVIQKAFKDFEESAPEGKFKSLISHLQALKVSDMRTFKDFLVSLNNFADLVEPYRRLIAGGGK